MSFADLKISRKLSLGFSAVVLTTAAMGGVTFLNLKSLDQSRQDVRGYRAALLHAKDARFYLARQENSYRGYLLTLDPYYPARVEKHRKAFEAELAELRKSAAGVPDLLAQADAAATAADKWHDQIVTPGVQLAITDPAARADAIRKLGPDGEADALMGPAEDAIEAIYQGELKRLEDAQARQGRLTVQTFWVLGLGVGLALALASGVALLLMRTIADPISRLTGAMRRLAAGELAVEIPAAGRQDEVGDIAAAVAVFKDAAIEKLRLEGETDAQRQAVETERQSNAAAQAQAAEQQARVVDYVAEGLEHLSRGDLTWRLEQDFPAEYAKLQSDFNLAISRLQDVLAGIAGHIQGLRSGAGEISSAADDLSRRTEQQAATLEQTAAALDQITAAVRNTAAGARQTAEAVIGARGDAEQSGVVVRDAVNAMSEIEASAKQISQIIGVIDEIAFQTNLLALNAGVEAARAGDAGRGFAVVASEVRALAQRSAEAAKEIKTLISASSAQVGSGVQLVGQTGEALQRIMTRVTEIDGLVSEIAASAQEQATGLAQVNTAVNQMDQATQQNAAMVEESTAASHALASEAEALARSVGRFRLGEPTVQTVRVAPEPTRALPRPEVRSLPAPRRATGGALRQPAVEADGWEEF